MDAQGKLLGRIGHVCRISEAVDGQTTCSQSGHVAGASGEGVGVVDVFCLPIGGRNTLMSDRVINWGAMLSVSHLSP